MVKVNNSIHPPCTTKVHFWHNATMQRNLGNGRATTLADPVQHGRWTGAYRDVFTACLRCSWPRRLNRSLLLQLWHN